MSIAIDSTSFDCHPERASGAQTTQDLDVALTSMNALYEQPLKDWRDLLANPLTQNPFLHPSYVKAGLDAGLDKGESAAFIVSRAGKLEGLFPTSPLKVRGMRIPGVWASELNLYHFNGAPLVAKDRAADVVKAWLQTIGSKDAPSVCVLRHMDLGSDLVGTIVAQAREMGCGLRVIQRYERPRLTREHDGFESHVKAVLSKRRVKDIRRNLRRLGEKGDVRLEHVTQRAAVAKRLEDFLRIEAAGWKGEAGTAFLSDEATARFARDAFATDGDAGLVSIDTLLVDDRPIAVSINLQSGTTRFTPKCAIDESYRSVSPGVLLEYLVIEAFYSGKDCELMDSAITTDSHIVAGFWNETAPHGDVILAKSNWQAVATAAVLNGVERSKPFLKRLRDKIS
ncbi:MAG: GNAT family N-acetyltransferase [Hyphomicrobiales bacterium]|jgi:CelD/BcsL family acetyltransferase involved in cellulose biosynthesis